MCGNETARMACGDGSRMAEAAEEEVKINTLQVVVSAGSWSHHVRPGRGWLILVRYSVDTNLKGFKLQLQSDPPD